MRWASRKSWLKRWIESHRQSCIDDVVIVSLLPRKCGYRVGATVVWLSPVLRKHKSSRWKPSSCFDPGYNYWSEYDAHSPKATWSTWWSTRPAHHFAGLVNFLVYWSWYPALIVGVIWYLYRSFF